LFCRSEGKEAAVTARRPIPSRPGGGGPMHRAVANLRHVINFGRGSVTNRRRRRRAGHESRPSGMMSPMLNDCCRAEGRVTHVAVPGVIARRCAAGRNLKLTRIAASVRVTAGDDVPRDRPRPSPSPRDAFLIGPTHHAAPTRKRGPPFHLPAA
jgi:hypothetical protein